MVNVMTKTITVDVNGMEGIAAETMSTQHIVINVHVLTRISILQSQPLVALQLVEQLSVEAVQTLWELITSVSKSP